MSTSHVKITGTLKPDGTLELDEKPDLPSGRVVVALTPEVVQAPPRDSTWDVLERIWRERREKGMVARSAEEIDSELAATRREWDERMERLERIQEECARAREVPDC